MMVCRSLTLLILFVCIFRSNAEISETVFEELVAHVKSLEQKLTKVEEKLENVQKELEEQKQINQKQALECFANKKTPDSEIDMEENKHDQRETIGQMEFVENLTGGNVFDKDVKRRHGDKGASKTRIIRQERENVAFSAYLNRDLSNLGPGHTIQFGATRLNEGNAFNAQTGIFTVPIDGVYLFAFACEDYHNHRIWADIMVDGTRESIVLEGPGGVAHSMGTNVVILRLTKGQSVWVAIDAGNHDDILQNTATTFSGVFLYY